MDVIGYNSDMRRVFSEKVITKTEKEAIVNWTIDSTEIKKVMWGISEDKKAKNYASHIVREEKINLNDIDITTNANANANAIFISRDKNLLSRIFPNFSTYKNISEKIYTISSKVFEFSFKFKGNFYKNIKISAVFKDELENIFTYHFVAPHRIKKVVTPYIHANFVPNRISK